MSTEVSGMIEGRPGARLWGPDNEDSRWHPGIGLFLVNNSNAYDAIGGLFGIRNHLGFRPPAEGRGLPSDALPATKAGRHSDCWSRSSRSPTDDAASDAAPPGAVTGGADCPSPAGPSAPPAPAHGSAPVSGAYVTPNAGVLVPSFEPARRDERACPA